MPPVSLRETKSISNIALHMFYQRYRLQRQKRKRKKECGETRFVFYSRWGAAM